MKIWFEKGYNFSEFSDVKIGIGWFTYDRRHPFKGFTIHLNLFQHIYYMRYVTNYKAYYNIIEKPFNKRMKKLKINEIY